MCNFRTALWGLGAAVLLAACAGGCSQEPLTCPRILFLDGAGWYTGDGSVRDGMTAAGYTGAVERFRWSMGVAPLDHAMAGPDHFRADALAGRITDLRRANPDGQIVVMGLSAGATMVVYALEKLTADIQVDHVVLLSPSISGRTDLREALSHVKGRVFVTVNPYDSILAIGDSSGPDSGDPAGRMGFTQPADLAFDDGGEALYRRIENIPWRREYAALGWQGGHVGATSSKFIQTVIAPRIMARTRRY